MLPAAILLVLGAILVGVPGAAGGAEGVDAAGHIAALPPRSGDVAGWAPDGSPQAAEGQELFALINGGAELFLRAGFDRVLTQAYRGDGERRVELEIYRMRSPEAAEAVFRQKTAGEESPIPLGAGGNRGEYYLIFWQDRFLVTVTGSDAGQNTMQGVERIARQVEEKIRQTPR
jgi:Family of unknown function (DUF6599)